MKNIVRVALVANLVVVSAAVAQAAPQKIGDDPYTLLLYACVILLSGFCGSITYARSYLKDDGHKHKLIRWFVDAGTAIISGLVVFWIAQNQGLGLWLTNVLVAAIAMGWVSVVDLIRTAFGKTMPMPPQSRND